MPDLLTAPPILPLSVPTVALPTFHRTVVVDPMRPREGRTIEEVPWVLGATVWDCLPEECWAADDDCYTTVLDGAVVPAAARRSMRMPPGGSLAVIVRPGIVSAIIFVVSLAINIGMAIDGGRRKRKQARHARRRAEAMEDSIVYAWAGNQPTTQPGEPIPVLYGRMRIGGHIIYAETRKNGAGKNVLDTQIALSEGEIDAVETSTIEINGKPVTKYPGLSYDSAVGTNSQVASTVIRPTSVSSVRNFPGNELVNAGAAVLYLTQPNTTGFLLTINFPTGLRAQVTVRATSGAAAGQTGQVWAAAEVTFTVRWRTYPSGTFTSPVTIKTGYQMTARGAFVLQYRSPLLAVDRYEIEVKRTGSTPLVLTGIYLGATFPDKSYLSQADEFSEPGLVYPNLALLNVSAVASAVLNGALPAITVIARGRKVPVWNGDTPATFTNTYSRNPAWIIYDLLTNTRYGAGNFVTSSDIDLTSFQTAAAFCDALVNVPGGGTEARSVCDFYFDGTSSPWEVAIALARAARLELVRGFGTLKLIPETTGSAVQLFTMGNIVKDSYRHTYLGHRNYPNRIEVQFLNADLNYQQDIAETEDPAVLTNAEQVQKTTVEGTGITRETQATRLALWTYLSNRYQREQIEFEVSAEALALEYGDVFIFVHALTRIDQFFSGRVGAGSTTTTVKLDQPIRVPIPTETSTVDLFVRHLEGSENDTQENVPIQASDYNQLTDTLSLVVPMVAAPRPGAIWAVVPRTTVFEKDKYWKVVALTRTKDGRRKVRALPYRTEVYEDGTIPPAEIE